MADQPRRTISGQELRLLADRAHAAGQKQLSMRLHDLAREQEAIEQCTP
jgi:hypothetical protein